MQASAPDYDLIGMVVGFLYVGLAALLVLYFVVWPILRPTCENCGEELPFFRIPRTWLQALHGRWTCPNCRRELDHRGRRLEPLSTDPLSKARLSGHTQRHTLRRD